MNSSVGILFFRDTYSVGYEPFKQWRKSAKREKCVWNNKFAVSSTVLLDI